MEWEYHKNSEKVATLRNEKGIMVLHVIEGRNGFCSVPCYSFINAYEASYSHAHAISGEQDGESFEESKEKRLKAGCYLIEQDYLSQVRKIKQIIG